MRWRAQTPAIGFSYAAGIVALFLHPAGQYFFGDSISVLTSRPLSWGAFFHDFIRLAGYHWYRPLDGLLPMLLYPHWRLDFALYHYFAMVQHWMIVMAVFLGLHHLLRDTFAAWVGAAFYAFHPTAFYATYDVCFYQEFSGIGLVIAALACLFWFAAPGRESGKIIALGLGLTCFLLALGAREVAVVTPGLLAILLWPDRMHNRSRATFAVGSASMVSATFGYFFFVVMHPLRYQPGGYTSDWQPANLARNFWMETRWAFGIAVGPETAGWQAPEAVRVLLAVFLLVLITFSLFFARFHPALWQGPAWFAVASIATLSTHRMLPHHLYLPLIGIAWWIGGLFTVLRGGMPRFVTTLARPAAAVLLSSIFVTSLISARNDSLNSWVGLNAQETRLAEVYSHSALRDMPKWKGLWIVVKDGDPSFSWLYGRVFRMMVDPKDEDSFETQLMPAGPVTVPRGIHVFEYRQSVLWPLAIPESNVPGVATAHVTVDPLLVHPGTSYMIRVPEMAGRAIDLRYSYNDHLTNVAYGFTQLKPDGTANIFTPRDTPWGVVEITGVRPVGAIDWAPVSVKVEVLRD